MRAELPAGAIYDWPAMCATLAAHEPWWEPGDTAHGYHVNTFGFLVGELVRRVDGQTLGAMVRREIAGPHGRRLLHRGAGSRAAHRVAEFIGMEGGPATPTPSGTVDRGPVDGDACGYFNPPEFSGAGVLNTTRWRTAELPSTNGHATGRGIARIFDALLEHGPNGQGTALVDPTALAEATVEQVYGDDLILHRPSRFGIGFQLTQAERPLGPNPGTFGHFGAGGSLGFCDPEARVAFGYAINTMGPRWQNRSRDPRSVRLLRLPVSSGPLRYSPRRGCRRTTGRR